MMAEPLRNYDGENESATVEPLPRALPTPTEADIREDPFVVGPEVSSTTERMGNAVGEAIGNLKSRVRSGMRVVSDRSKDAGETISDMTESAQAKAREISQEARIRADELRRSANMRLRQARSAARRAVNEHPMETILAIGGVAVVIGFLMRIWRSSRD